MNGSVSKRPSDASQGGVCPQGSYCPSGSSRPILCDAGQFCSSQGLHKPSGNCTAGFYCLLGAKISQPNDNITGNICPAGSYCLERSQTHTFCPPGTLSNSSGTTELKDCLSCSPGHFCMGYGNSVPSGPCDAGYYCPGGQQRADPSGLQCQVGHYCPTGSSKERPCQSGYYQDEMKREDCKVCGSSYLLLWLLLICI